MLYIEKNDSSIKEVKFYELDEMKGPLLIKSLHQFPNDYYNIQADINVLFSPDLLHYLDYDKLVGEFKIVSTLRNVDKKKLRILHGMPVNDEDEEFN